MTLKHKLKQIKSGKLTAFENLMFLNAPFVEEDSIVAEKGRWKR